MIYTNPLLVSVFYVDVPNDLQGGELVIKVKNEELQIKPQINTLVFFLGNLSHKVNQVKSSQPRISLVCEQYKLDADRLQSIPEFEIKSGVRRD
jgi:predicted 2-oxoglutarate/Fe(II)-dependent dioxygenase YbiX